LRRENLYSNQLQQWRRELEQGGAANLNKTSPGPKASKTPEQRRIEQLEKEKAQLKRKLQMTQDCVDLQKKALSMLDQATSGNNE
jgi:transposase-like protein